MVLRTVCWRPGTCARSGRPDEGSRRLEMSTKLPELLAGYFAAANVHDVGAMLAPFADDAVVKDESREHRGREAIRKWMEETIRKYDFTLEPADVSESGRKTVVTTVVAGKFPGSPVRLRYAFSLSRDKIRRLEIG